MIKTIIAVFTGLVIGVSAAFFSMKSADAQTAISNNPTKVEQKKSDFKYQPKATLYRFEVIAGKEQKFAEWMKFLNDNRAAAVQTLEREKTYFESVFTEKLDDKTYVFWLEFKGEGGKPFGDSPFELDKKHLEFWNECIKKGSGETFKIEFYLTPEFLDKAILQHQKTEKN